MGRAVKIMTILAAFWCCLTLGTMPHLLSRAAAESETAAARQSSEPAREGQAPPNASRAAREEKALQDARRQQLAEKEAMLAAKEQELKKLSAKLESQIKTLEENKKRLDDSLKAQTTAQKKAQDEKIQKMVKLFKTLRSEQAGKLIDGLNDDLALSLMSRLDTKTIAKLTPFINQPRVLKWVAGNLQER
jgi:flagellar motility protein MotE (MotC chaperone)